MSNIKIGAAEVMVNFLWKKENKFPEIDMKGNKVEINQQSMMDYLMKFQKFILDELDKE